MFAQKSTVKCTKSIYYVLFHVGVNSTSSWQSKVIGGDRDERRVSFLAGIANEVLGQYCTGYVISTLYIVSAAFCIYYRTFDENYDYVYAIVGWTDRAILFMEYHPCYVVENNAFDIGLIRVSNVKTSKDIILFSMRF